MLRFPFFLNLIFVALQLAQMNIDDPNYCETTAWYTPNGKKAREGLIPKAIRLSKSVKIKDKTEYSIIAKVPSETADKEYDVKIILNLDNPLIIFYCTCPWGEFRARPCKHVLAVIFKAISEVIEIDENKIIYDEGFISYADEQVYQLLTAIHNALNKSAYLRVKMGEPYT